MGSPSGVCNTNMGVKNLGHIWLLLLDEFPELGDLSDFFKGEYLILLVSINSETCRVIPTVLKSR